MNTSSDNEPKTDSENTESVSGAGSPASPCSAADPQDGHCQHDGASAIPSGYGLKKGQVVYLKCEVSAIKHNCVVSVRPLDMGFPSADFNVHRNHIVDSPNTTMSCTAPKEDA